jgi:hypothetical protein
LKVIERLIDRRHRPGAVLEGAQQRSTQAVARSPETTRVDRTGLTSQLAHAGHAIDDQNREEQHEHPGHDRRGERMSRPVGAA